VTHLGRFGFTVVSLAVLVPIAACSKDSDSAPRDYLARGNRYVEQNTLPEAVITYRIATRLAADPANLAAYGGVGQLFYSQGRLDEARREFERDTERDPNARARESLEKALKGKGDFKDGADARKILASLG